MYLHTDVYKPLPHSLPALPAPQGCRNETKQHTNLLPKALPPPPPAPLSTTYLCALTKQTSNEKRENKIVVTAGCVVVLLRLTRGEINHRYGGRAIDMVHKSLSLEETKHGEHAQSDQREAGGDRAG
jgi:hypothetical protein